jgi:hypothetical protein
MAWAGRKLGGFIGIDVNPPFIPISLSPAQAFLNHFPMVFDRDEAPIGTRRGFGKRGCRRRIWDL